MTVPRSPFAGLSTDRVHEIARQLLICEDALSEAAAGQVFVPKGAIEALLHEWDQCEIKPEPLREVWVELIRRTVGAGVTPRVCVPIAPLDALLTATREALPPGWRSYYHHRGRA